jgi:hypothetical protein
MAFKGVDIDRWIEQHKVAPRDAGGNSVAALRFGVFERPS